MTIEFNEHLAQKILQTVDAGLTAGLGNPVPGQMCVEAAVSYALGLPHYDSPSCVGSAVRSFKICLNDLNWSSDKARANGMRKLAVAQIGSDQIDQLVFAEKLIIKTVQVLLPDVFDRLKIEFDTNIFRSVQSLAETKVITAAAAESAATLARHKSDVIKATHAARRAALYAAADASFENETYATTSASAAAYWAAYAVKYAWDAASAIVNTSDPGYQANVKVDLHVFYGDIMYAAGKTVTYASLIDCAPDHYFVMSADICLDVLKDMNSPGCKFLYLCG